MSSEDPGRNHVHPTTRLRTFVLLNELSRISQFVIHAQLILHQQMLNGGDPEHHFGEHDIEPIVERLKRFGCHSWP